MGKKGKKTRWRELPITLADKPYAAPEQQHQQSGRQTTADAKPVNFAAAAGKRNHQHNTQYQQQQQQQQQQSSNCNHSSATTGHHQPQQQQQQQHHHHHHVESSTVTFNEDEYTKITTPRQDVLFKKGYLGRRKQYTSVPVIAEVLNENEDGASPDAIISPLDELCAHSEYVDSSTMYMINGGGYEVYDPYTGNVTILMGPPPSPGHYPAIVHPMLAAMTYQPVPLQPVDWFNPSTTVNEQWMSGGAVYQSNRRHKKVSSTDAQQQNYGVQTTEINVGAQESTADDQQAVYQSQQPYNVYPGYVFGAPLYNYNGMNIQVPQPQSPPSPSISCDYVNGKRRKKKKRRKRGGVTDEYSDSSSEEQKSQSGASSDHVPDSEKTSDSGVLTNNSGGSTPVNVQLSHTAPPFHMECPQPFEILHGAPILVRHHPDQMAAYYQPIPQYTEQLTPIGYPVIPEEQTAETADDQPDGEPVTGYSAENSDSGISSPNSEVMVKGGLADNNNKHEKPQATDGGQTTTTTMTTTTTAVTTTTTTTTAVATTTTTKKSRNKKSKQRDKLSDSTITGTKAKGNNNNNNNKESQKDHYETGGGKKSSKIAKEPAIIKKLNAKKAKGKPDGEKSKPAKRDERKTDETDKISETNVVQLLSIGAAETEWAAQDDEFCSLECTPRSTTDGNAQFHFSKTQSLDSCESVEEETFATAVNTGNSDTETETRHDDGGGGKVIVVVAEGGGDNGGKFDAAAAAAVPLSNGTPPGPITEAVTKWLNDQGGLMLAPCLDDSGTDDGGDSEYDDFVVDEHPAATAATGPKNGQGNPYPALSRSEGSRVAGAPSHEQQQRQKSGLVSSGICCLTQ